MEFNSNEKGTKKQKRCDYDSDRSYEGLGLEYERSKLLTHAKKDTFLPYTNRWNCPSKLDMVDFAYQAAKSSRGDHLLFESLQNEDVDDLVGLATVFDLGSKDKNDSRIRNGCGQGENESGDIQSQSTIEAPVFQDPQKHNPLLLLQHHSPLPPSYLDYIKSRALKQLGQDDCNINDYKKNNIESFGDSAAVATGIFLEECLTASLLPLAGLHVLRCRAIETMTSAEIEFGTMPTFNTNIMNNNDVHPDPKVYNGGDDDDTYALKQTVLHPITGEEIHLDMNKIRWKDETAFEEWTLPPEEAILKLREQEMLSKEKLYHFVPDASRSSRRLATDERNHRKKAANHCLNASVSTVESDRFTTFAMRYNVDSSLVAANQEIFDIFMIQKNAAIVQQQQPLPPSSLPI